MKKLLPTAILLSCIILFACKAQQKKSTYSEITFGSGGGITGKYIEYSLKSDGSITKNVFDNNPKILKQLDKKQCKALFEKAAALKLESIDLDVPANMNKYIIVKTDIGTHKINWGGSKFPAEDIVKFYDELMLLVK
jgi:hypothetical protein